MSRIFSRSVLALVSVSALSLACSSDQKTPNTPEDVPPAAADTAAPSDGAMPPNGEPTNTPPDAPPPQGLNDADRPVASGNAIAAPPSSSAPGAAPQLSASQIAMITERANSAEIEQAKLAQGKAKAASVKQFAAKMVKHHTEAKQEQSKLYKQLSLTPAQSQTSTSLKEGADKTMSSLRDAGGTAFDAAYMDSQIEAHQGLLDALDQQLLPAATDQQLRDALTKMRATVEAHLKEAKSIRADLSNPTAR
ncbi:MAG: DUF4142 domain-containing protein [Myxococcales bacterium]